MENQLTRDSLSQLSGSGLGCRLWGRVVVFIAEGGGVSPRPTASAAPRADMEWRSMSPGRWQAHLLSAYTRNPKPS